MSLKTKQKYFVHFLQKFPNNARDIVLTCILSLSAGLSAVAFLFLTNFLFSKTFLHFASKSVPYFLIASFVVITVTSLIVGYLLNVFSKEAAGSGIPHVKSAYWKEIGYINIKPVLVKFIAGVLSIGGGNSLGREGPSVYLGSGIASNLAGVFGAARRERRSAALIGASAGLAAAFNTPLAAITFVIEEIIGDMNSRNLGRVFLAAVIGAFTVHALIGRQPAFSIPSIENVTWAHYMVVPVVAGFASMFGVIFHHATVNVRGRIKKQTRVPGWLLPVFGGIITWIIGCSIFLKTGKIGVFGLGYQDLSNVLNNHFDWKIAGFLVVGKLLATIIGYSFGGCGGIFAPSLFVGGLTGFFVGGVAGIWIPLTPSDHIVLVTVGMSTFLGALIRAPLTSMLIVFEMTHQFSLIPGLMLGTIISQAVSHHWSSLNFYDALLVQDGHELHKIRPPVDLQSWQNLPISAIASPNPVGLENVTEKEIRNLLNKYPYNAFPVFSAGTVKGIVTRQQLQEALQQKNTPEIQEIAVCYADQTVKDVGNKFVSTAVNVLIVLDKSTNAIAGIITLHDLIRAQAAIQN